MPAITRCNDCHGGREGSEAGVDAHTRGPGGRRRRFQELAGGPIVPMAWQLLRKWHFVYQFATELSMRSSGGPLRSRLSQLSIDKWSSPQSSA